jgi:hypothetical protein
MTMLKPQTPFGYTVFCDDIRREISDKITLVGVYTGDLQLQADTPATLTSLSMLINYFERPGESTEAVKICVFVPGDNPEKPRVNFDLPPDFREIDHQDKDTDDPINGVSLQITLVGFEVPEVGHIRVRAFRGQDEIRIGSLRILSKPASEEPRSFT